MIKTFILLIWLHFLLTILKNRYYKSMKNLLEEDHELQKLVDKFQLFFEPDPSLQPGDVVINSEAVDIEAQLETKLKEIENYLQENLNV